MKKLMNKTALLATAFALALAFALIFALSASQSATASSGGTLASSNDFITGVTVASSKGTTIKLPCTTPRTASTILTASVTTIRPLDFMSYQWQRNQSNGWKYRASDANGYTKTVTAHQPATKTYRVRVSYVIDDDPKTIPVVTTLGDDITITWVNDESCDSGSQPLS